MKKRTQLRVNILTSLGATLLSTVVMAAAYPLYLHYLGYEQYGIWLVLSTVITMAQVGNLGISPALIKLVAEDFSSGDIDGVYRYIGCGILTLLSSGAVLVAAVLLFRRPIVSAFGIGHGSADLVFRLLPWVGALSVYLLICDALNSVLAGLGRYDLVSYSQVLGQLITVGSAVVLFQHHYGVWSLLIANLLDAIFIHAVSVFFIRRIAGRNILAHVRFEKQRLQRLLDFGSWVFGASILNTVIYPLNRVFITRYAGVAAVPIYDISLATAFKIRSFFESGFRSLTPEFSRVQAARPIEAQGYLAAADHKGLKVVVFLGTPVYLVVFAVCGFGLKLWLGARFTPEIPQIFRVLLIGTYLGLWGLQPWYSLLGFGRSRDILGSNAIQALAGLTYIIAAPRSLETVAIGTSLGMLASTLYLRVQASKLRSGFSGFRKRHPCVFNHFPG